MTSRQRRRASTGMSHLDQMMAVARDQERERQRTGTRRTPAQLAQIKRAQEKRERRAQRRLAQAADVEEAPPLP